MPDDIEATLQQLIRSVASLESSVNNLRDDLVNGFENVNGKIDKLRDIVADQAGEISAVQRRTENNKKKLGGSQMRLPAKSTLF